MHLILLCGFVALFLLIYNSNISMLQCEFDNNKQYNKRRKKVVWAVNRLKVA